MLGSDRAAVVTPSGPRRLTARHSEIVTLLALHPAGLGSRDLARLLYGEPGHEVAVRAECHRLREILGPALATRPYRLDRLESDLDEVLRRLDDGDLVGAERASAGALLEGSPVPAIAVARDELARRMGDPSRDERPR